jgi:hypothetical protein
MSQSQGTFMNDEGTIRKQMDERGERGERVKRFARANVHVLLGGVVSVNGCLVFQL